MVRTESLALELLTYKVGDFLRGEEPAGGVASMWQLMEYLRSRVDNLDRAERGELDELALRLEERERSKIKPETDTLESLVLGIGEPSDKEVFDTDFGDVLVLDAMDEVTVTTPNTPGRVVDRRENDEIRAERLVLRRIAERAWWDDVEEFVRRTAAGWRADRERVTPRLIYATLQNLDRYHRSEASAQDVNLRRFKVTIPVPERKDPLVSFSDLETLAEIVRNLLEAILSVKEESGLLSGTDVATADAFEYVKTAALKVSQDPYAGKLSLLGGKEVTSDQIRMAIRELAKERMADRQKVVQRRHLEQRLAETQAHERTQRQMFQRDTHRFADLIHGFFERLANHLPVSVGGKGAGPQLPGTVLFGVHPGLRVEKVPPGADAITVRLIGPLRFTIAGIDVAVTGTGATQALFVGDQEYPLSAHMSVTVDGWRLGIYHYGEYLHVRVRARNRSLASTMGEALVVFYVLSQPETESMLATLALVSNAIQGEPPNLISLAIDRIGAITAATPNRRDAIEGLVRGSARAVGATIDENALMGLIQRLHVAITAQPGDIAAILQQLDGKDATVHHLGSAPITVEVGGLKLTLREFPTGREHDPNVVVMLPGQVLGSFSKFLLEPLHEGTLVCARAEHEVAVSFIPDTSIATPRAV